MLIVKRIIYFMVNMAIAVLLFILAELIVAYSKHIFGMYVPPFNAGNERASTRFYMLILPGILALFDSKIMGGGFLGGRLTGCRTIVSDDISLSFIACFLRASLLFLPTAIYISVFAPFKPPSILRPSSILDMHIIDIVFIFTYIFIPISVIIGKGQQGLHDRLLNISFIRRKDVPTFKTGILKHFSLSLFLSLILASIAYVVIVNSDTYKSYMYYMTMLVERFPDLGKLEEDNSKAIHSADNIVEFLEPRVKRNSIIMPYWVGLDPEWEEKNGEKFIVANLASTLDLSNQYMIDKVAGEVAIILNQYNGNVDKLKLKISNRYLFDVVAFERSVVYLLERGQGGFWVSYDRDAYNFGRGLPFGFPSTILSLDGD